MVGGECGTEALVVRGIETRWYVASKLSMALTAEGRDEYGSQAVLVRVIEAAAGRGVAVMMTFVIRRRCGRPPGQRA